MTEKNRFSSSSSHSRASIIKSIASSEQERKSLEWVEDMLLEDTSKQESRSDYTSDTWARIVASELTMADVDKKIQQVEEQLFGPKPKAVRDKKAEKKAKQVEVVEEEEEEEEDGSEPRYFTFDLGRLDDHVNDIIKLLDTVSYPARKPMLDTSGLKSVYTATRENTSRLGLQVILNRVAVVMEYKNIKTSREFPTASVKVNITSEAKSNIWEKLKSMKISEALRTIAQRTDSVFGKELGIISGSLLLYPRHAILLLEGPEISLVDYFRQLYESSIMQRIIKGKVMFIMPNVLIRYFEEWTDMEAIPPEMESELSVTDPVKIKKLLKLFGNKCAFFWKYLRRNKLTGVGRTCDEVPANLLPEEMLLDLALESNTLRPLHQWLVELIHLDYQEEIADESWPETNFVLAETSFKPDHYTESLGLTVKSNKPPPNITPQIDKFLTANKKHYEQGEPEQVTKDENKESIAKQADTRKNHQQETIPEKVLKAKSVAWKTRKKKTTK